MSQSINTNWIWNSPTVFLSDLHINGGPRDKIIIKNIKSLFSKKSSETLAYESGKKNTQNYKRLVLLGDIFDFNLSYSHTLYQKHFAFYMCLQELVLQGIEIIVFTGNHDPESSKFLTDSLGIQVIEEAINIKLYDDIARLEHGDLLEPNFLKRKLCQLVRSPAFCRLARLIPANIMWIITSKWGTKEPKVQGLDPEIPPAHCGEIYSIIEKHWPNLQAQGVKYWVFGHFHQALSWSAPHLPSLHEEESTEVADSSSVASKNDQVFVLGDQVGLYSYLHWDINGPCLQRFNLEHKLI